MSIEHSTVDDDRKWSGRNRPEPHQSKDAYDLVADAQRLLFYLFVCVCDVRRI